MNLIPLIANYITRYAPSEKKIGAYLTKKKCQNIDAILSQIHYDERLMADMWMRSFVALGKGEREIRMKLTKKEFPKSLIDEVLVQSKNEIYDWETNRHAVEHQITTLESRGKSRQIILQTLISKYPYFRDEIVLCMSECSDEIALKKEVEKYKSRYNLSIPNEKQKFFAAILRKGFRFEDIKKELEKN